MTQGPVSYTHLDVYKRQVFVRSPFAHASIVSIDAEDARKAPGVIGVFTACLLYTSSLANSLGAEAVDQPRLDVALLLAREALNVLSLIHI